MVSEAAALDSRAALRLPSEPDEQARAGSGSSL